MAEQKTIVKDVKTFNKAICEVINDFRQQKIKPKDADVVINGAGKYFKGVAVQLENRKQLGGKYDVEGL